MDWHFRVHQRTAEFEKRGQYCSPFVDEIDWIETPLTLDTDYVHPANSLDDSADGSSTRGAAGTKAKQQAKVQYIRVPDPSSGVNRMCPICQEEFEMKWHDEAQEWVWMDAVKVGERVFHASCYGEVAGVGKRTGTPEVVLGKRKAEDDFQKPAKGKVKVEGYGYGY